VRDPRDIAVSAYFQSLRNAKKVGADSVVRGDGGPMFDYVALRKLPQVIAFLKRWQAQLPGIKGAMVVRYEDLRVRPEAELARVMAFIDGEPPRREEIESAVTFASFDNLRAKEAANFFSTDRLRPADPSDPDSFKVRRGKVGGYRDYFTPQEQARMEAMVADAKLETFGYLPRSTVEEG
jgi:sulfotransferase family protein